MSSRFNLFNATCSATLASVFSVSIHAPLCGVRPRAGKQQQKRPAISIHAPLCGVRQLHALLIRSPTEFQSTHPCAGCDLPGNRVVRCHVISIHAPLCGVRPDYTPPRQGSRHFNPRTPVRGATKTPRPPCIWLGNFNPRTPVRGATDNTHPPQQPKRISIHAPLCGVRRAAVRAGDDPHHHFNPRTPVRGATTGAYDAMTKKGFISIHAPLCGVRQSRRSSRIPCQHGHFNPRTPVRGATYIQFDKRNGRRRFQSTHPCAGCDHGL